MLFQLSNVDFKGILHYDALVIQNHVVTFLCGKSGCGKSTLFRLLNQTQSPSQGDLLFEGKPLTSYDPIALRKRVLLCGQSVYLADGSIRENFALFYQYRNLPCPSDQQIESLLAICQLRMPLDQLCQTLSGGERQRVYNAIHLSFHPQVLLFDEPTSALDDSTAVAFFEAVIPYCKEHHMTPIFICHNHQHATQFAEQIVTLGGTCHE